MYFHLIKQQKQYIKAEEKMLTHVKMGLRFRGSLLLIMKPNKTTLSLSLSLSLSTGVAGKKIMNIGFAGDKDDFIWVVAREERKSPLIVPVGCRTFKNGD
jgi:hypothetical protein